MLIDLGVKLVLYSIARMTDIVNEDGYPDVNRIAQKLSKKIPRRELVQIVLHCHSTAASIMDRAAEFTMCLIMKTFKKTH